MSAERDTTQPDEPETVTMHPCRVPGCEVEKSDPAHLTSHLLDDHTFDEWTDAMRGEPVERDLADLRDDDE